jgi:carboxyl-terminal processing protease
VDKGTANSAQDAAREKAREEARKRLDAELAKPPSERRKVAEFGAPDDFQLIQALNQLKGKPVLASGTTTAAAPAAKSN